MPQNQRIMITNPFIINGYIPSEYFCDRKEESKKLTQMLTNGENVCLMSPRRMGKSKLIQFCYDQEPLCSDHYCFYIDIFHTTSLREFTYTFGRQVFSTLRSKSQKMTLWFVQALKSLSADFGFDPSTGMPKFSLSLGDVHNPEFTLEEIFKALEQADKPCIVCFDEFQQIANYPEKNIEALLRTHVQQASNTHFIFAGSEYHIMQKMFMSSARPFYNSADTLELKAIDIDIYTEFVIKLMKSGDRTITPQLVKTIYQLYRGNTYAMQKTFNELYSISDEGTNVTTDMVITAINNVIDSKEPMYREQLSNIPDKHKPLLYAIAQEGEAERITSAKFVKDHKLASASAVQYAATQLLTKGVITKLASQYAINDPFFALWINRLYGHITLAQLLTN